MLLWLNLVPGASVMTAELDSMLEEARKAMSIAARRAGFSPARTRDTLVSVDVPERLSSDRSSGELALFIRDLADIIKAVSRHLGNITLTIGTESGSYSPQSTEAKSLPADTVYLDERLSILLAGWFLVLPVPPAWYRILNFVGQEALWNPRNGDIVPQVHVQELAERLKDKECRSIVIEGCRGSAYRVATDALRKVAGDFASWMPVLFPPSPRRSKTTPLADLLDMLDRGTDREQSRTMSLHLRKRPYRQSAVLVDELNIQESLTHTLTSFARCCSDAGIPAWILVGDPEGFDPAVLTVILESIQSAGDRISGEVCGTGVIFLLDADSPRPEPDSEHDAGTACPPWLDTEHLHIETGFTELVRKAREALSGTPPGSVDAITAARGAARDPLRLAVIAEIAQRGLKTDIGPEVPVSVLASVLFHCLPMDHVRYLALVGLAEGVLDPSGYKKMLADCGFPARLGECIDSYWRSLGIIVGHPDFPVPLYRDFIGLARDCLLDGGKELVRSFMTFLEPRIESGILVPGRALLRSAASIAPQAKMPENNGRSGSRPGRQDTGTHTQRNGTMTSAASPWFENPERIRSYMLEAMMDDVEEDADSASSWNAEDSPAWAFPAFLLAQSRSDRIAAEAAITTLRSSLPEDALKDAALSLVEALHAWSSRNGKAAVIHAKDALLAASSAKLPGLESKAHLILGLGSLESGRLVQGTSYLANAAEHSLSVRDYMGSARAKIMEAGVTLAMGDFAATESLATEIEALGLTHRMPFPRFAATFIRGRCAFELGRYALAASLFRNLYMMAGEYRALEVLQRAGIWQARCTLADLFQAQEKKTQATGQKIAADAAVLFLKQQDSDAEAVWFLSEHELRLGHTTEARLLADKALARTGFKQKALSCEEDKTGYRGVTSFSWSDGYSSLEGLVAGCAPERRLGPERILAYWFMVRGLSEPADSESSIESLLSMAREQRIAEIHPFSHLYYFAAYRISVETDCVSSSPLSLLTRAFRALQHRAGRLQAEKDFDDFFESNIENIRILSAAKRSRLM